MSLLFGLAIKIVGEKFAGLAVYGLIAVLVTGTLGGTWYALKWKYINEGWNMAIAAVAAENEAAKAAVANQRSNMRACRASGGVWDSTRESGQCVRR